MLDLDIDILDSKGNKVGWTRCKVEVHEEGLWHASVHVWFLNDNKELLLQRRLMKRAYPNFLDASVAGHVYAGERSGVSAINAIKHELGVEIKKEELIFVGTVASEQYIETEKHGVYINKEFADIFIVPTHLNLAEFDFDTEEIGELMYVPFETFREWVKEGKQDLIPRKEEYELLLGSISLMDSVD